VAKTSCNRAPTSGPCPQERSRTFVLDLAGQPIGTRGSVDVTLTWGIVLNDFDLDVDGESSQNIQPLDDAVEEVTTPLKNHCGRITASAINFSGLVVVDSLELALQPRLRKP
jgi:hypothetical protein